MTKNEFIELYDKFLNPNEMSISEYQKIWSDIDSNVWKALDSVYKKFSIFVRDMYDIDYDFSPREFMKVSSDGSTRDDMRIAYGDCDSVSFITIPLEAIASWVAGDFKELIEKSYENVKFSLERDIANCKRTIQNMTSEIESAQKILDEIAINESNEEVVDKENVLSKYWDFIDNYAI